jgi:hypothetical protein
MILVIECLLDHCQGKMQILSIRFDAAQGLLLVAA